MTAREGQAGDGEPVYLVVGRLRRPHGIHGEIIMDVITDFPERLRKGTRVYAGEQHRELRIRSRRENGASLLLTFEGYPTPDAVGELRNELLYVPAADRPALPEGEYYHHELIGMQVITDESRYLGKLKSILDYAAHDIYVVQPEEGPELLLPAIESVILDVDVENATIRVHLLPGLLGDEA